MPPSASAFQLAFATPRKLPKPRELAGNVVVLDIAFVSEAGGQSFEKVTLPFINGLGPRLSLWVDHHDSVHHGRFADDPRFFLRTKAEHGACPEMIDKALVERTGKVDTIVCHGDFDGLASAAKWMRGGIEPYEGCDADARAIDTRLGTPSAIAARFDRAIRAKGRDHALLGFIVRHLAEGLKDASLWQPIDEAGSQLVPLEERARHLARGYEHVGKDLVIVEASQNEGAYDKTLLLLLGQERARAAAVIDGDNVTFAARFDSGINFLTLFGLSGGMPTVISIQRSRLRDALIKLGVSEADLHRFASRD
ncbi:MAG: hypothetical protein IPK82_21355 [Polyangiaceae bacterium]|nr:hypothetical protein [Polyangiaceae bacterium]